MRNNGADSEWYKDILKDPEATRKYHKYFRQKDSLKAIPKILEEKLQKEDEEAYNKILEDAAEARAALDTDSIISVDPPTAVYEEEKDGQ